MAHDPVALADPPAWLIDEIRIRGTSSGGSGLFIGVSATADVRHYLADVAHDELTDLIFNGDSTIRGLTYVSREGTIVPTAPGLEDFWVESVEGAGVQTLDWSVESGDWTVVVMNTDAIGLIV